MLWNFYSALNRETVMSTFLSTFLNCFQTEKTTNSSKFENKENDVQNRNTTIIAVKAVWRTKSVQKMNTIQKSYQKNNVKLCRKAASFDNPQCSRYNNLSYLYIKIHVSFPRSQKEPSSRKNSLFWIAYKRKLHNRKPCTCFCLVDLPAWN